MGKVKFGLSGFEYGKVSEQNTVTATKKLPGMKSAKLELTNELLTISADDGPGNFFVAVTVFCSDTLPYSNPLKPNFTLPIIFPRFLF
jgi:hypothetical protein